MTVIILPSREARCQHLHDDLVRLVRAQARAWLAAGESTEAFQRVMASELQSLTALLARELGDADRYMAAAAMSWNAAPGRPYTGDDLCNDSAGLVS